MIPPGGPPGDSPGDSPNENLDFSSPIDLELSEGEEEQEVKAEEDGVGGGRQGGEG